MIPRGGAYGPPNLTMFYIRTNNMRDQNIKNEGSKFNHKHEGSKSDFSGTCLGGGGGGGGGAPLRDLGPEGSRSEAKGKEEEGNPDLRLKAQKKKKKKKEKVPI